jgi:uncharacterized protein
MWTLTPMKTNISRKDTKLRKGNEMKSTIDVFMQSPAIGVVGVSRNPRKFGSAVYRELKKHGRRGIPVHPTLQEYEGDRCVNAVKDLPAEVTSVLTVVPPAVTEHIVDDCIARGVSSIWMQRGSESPSAIAKAEKAGIRVVHGQCFLMFLEPVSGGHAMHRFFVKLFGKYPH